jgi:hypothetical protein
VRRNTLLIDIGIAVAIGILVLIVTPGLAVAGMIALLVVLVCGVTLVLDARRAAARRSRLTRRPGRGR